MVAESLEKPLSCTAILQDLVFLVHRGFLHVCCENALSLSIFAEFSNLFGHFQFSALALRFSRSQTSTPANFATFESAVGSLVFLCFFMLSRLAWTAESLLRCRRDDSTDHSRIWISDASSKSDALVDIGVAPLLAVPSDKANASADSQDTRSFARIFFVSHNIFGHLCARMTHPVNSDVPK